MGLNIILTCSLNPEKTNISHTIHSLFSLGELFFDIHGKIAMTQISTLSNKLNTANTISLYLYIQFSRH